MTEQPPAPEWFTLTPATATEIRIYEQRHGPIGYRLIPIELPEFPLYAGKRWEVVNKRMAELGARSVTEMTFFLGDIGWTYYDVLEAESP